jgi:Helix-loop-helix DNA-binding domain
VGNRKAEGKHFHFLRAYGNRTLYDGLKRHALLTGCLFAPINHSSVELLHWCGLVCTTTVYKHFIDCQRPDPRRSRRRSPRIHVAFHFPFTNRQPQKRSVLVGAPKKALRLPLSVGKLLCVLVSTTAPKRTVPEMDQAAAAPGGNRDNAGSAAMKRPAADDESSADDGASNERGDDDRQDSAAMSRSERKRHREKKRRSDVNRGFDELTNLLIEVDPEVRAEAEERSRRGLWKGSLGAQDDNLLSRVDLISRTVSVLRRIHNENEERKALINQLVLQREAMRMDIIPGAGRSEVRFTATRTAQRPRVPCCLHQRSILTRSPSEVINARVNAFQQPSPNRRGRPCTARVTIVRAEPADVVAAAFPQRAGDVSLVAHSSARNKTAAAAINN